VSTHVDCRVALTKLYEYLDGELGLADREAIAAHLEVCRPCLSEFEIERLFHEFVTRCAPRPEARAEFKERLLSRIAMEATATSPPTARPGDASRDENRGFFPLMGRFVLAAVIVLGLGLGAGWLAQQYRGGRSDWFTLGGYHHDLIPVEETGIETTDFAAARAFVAEHLDPALADILPARLPDNLTVHASCVMPWRSGKMAHLELARAGSEPGQTEDLSVFVIPAGCSPEKMGPEVYTTARCYQTAVLGCCRVVAWHDCDKYDCVMIADTEVGQLVSLAEAWEAMHGQSAGSDVPGAPVPVPGSLVGRW
jgi:mycothiol system anti-sigma-R factor